MEKVIRKQQRVAKEISLTLDERDLLRTFEQGEWRSVKNLKEEKAVAKKAAATYLHKCKP